MTTYENPGKRFEGMWEQRADLFRDPEKPVKLRMKFENYLAQLGWDVRRFELEDQCLGGYGVKGARRWTAFIYKTGYWTIEACRMGPCNGVFLGAHKVMAAYVALAAGFGDVQLLYMFENPEDNSMLDLYELRLQAFIEHSKPSPSHRLSDRHKFGDGLIMPTELFRHYLAMPKICGIN